MNTKKFKTIDDYIKSLGKEDKKLALEYREVINSLGKFTETISYNMPSFKNKEGKIVSCFLVCKNHIGYYPYSGNIISKFKKELKDYKTSTGAIQFPKDLKINKTLIKKLIFAREKELKGNIK
jgi:uncharacterized protein YdhG (YjbR/CyaY superfamily)